MSLEVENPDAYYQEWRDKVEIRRAPHNEPLGTRTFGATDRFGNSIFVIGPLA